MGKYDDIINLPHHVSQFYKPMPMENRAAQFAPFAALSGHDEAIKETARLTEFRKELSEVEINNLSITLEFALSKHLPVTITYFSPDKKKSGGSYETVSGVIRKWEETDNILIMEQGEAILVPYISDIRID